MFNMIMAKDLNRLKVVLAEKKITNRQLAEKLGKDEATISKWCTNNLQPNLEMLIKIISLVKIEKYLYFHSLLKY